MRDILDLARAKGARDRAEDGPLRRDDPSGMCGEAVFGHEPGRGGTGLGWWSCYKTMRPLGGSSMLACAASTSVANFWVRSPSP